MGICKDDQIKNPISKKCVAINGTTGKKLIKKFIDGEIVLDPSNVQKISNKKVETTKLKSIVKSTIKSKSVSPNISTVQPSVKSSIKFSKCESNKIYNPLTKKCVTISGPSGKKIINAHKNKELTLNLDNVKKLISKKLLSPKKVTKSLLPPGEVSENAKLKVHNFVKAWKAKQEIKKKNEEYEKYCKTLKPEDLDKPIVNMSMTVDFPVASMTTSVGFNLESLNHPHQKFTYNKISGIQLNFNNYSLRHLLYKGEHDSIKYIENLIDDEWLIKMNKYISELSTKDIYTLIGYTHYGDVIANSYMRRKISKSSFSQDVRAYDKWFSSYYPMFFQALNKIEKMSDSDIDSILKDGKDIEISIQYPTNLSNGMTLNKNKFFTGKILVSKLLKQLNIDKTLTVVDKYIILYNTGRYISFSKFWQDVIRQYTYDLDSIIDKSPAITKKMIVYRGVKGDYYLKGNKNHIYKTDSFVSTSINLPSALRFSGGKCCFKRITLLPGTKTVLLAGISRYKNEIELLLGSKSHFYITSAKNNIPKSTVDMCNQKKSGDIMVTDLVVVK